MRTVLIHGTEAVPAPLREMIERGSTAFEQHKAIEMPDAMPAGFDRIVFWSNGETVIRALASRYAAKEAADGREVLVFVTGGPDPDIPGLSPAERYSWPGDEDRLRMAFLTGA